MNFDAVAAQLADLPATYTRTGDDTFGQVMDTLVDALASFTNASDGANAQLTFASAQWGWLDVWGLLLGVGRHSDESDVAYRNRISFTLDAWVGTIPAIEMWGSLILGTVTLVTENAVGYTITLPTGISTAQATAFITSLRRVRPVGVPFNVQQQTDGLFINTINYLGTWETIGSYLDDGLTSLPLNISDTTVNASPLLPTIYLTDPTLNQ